MMVRTQISLDDPRCELLDDVTTRTHEDRTAVIREAVARLVRLSGQTAAEALLAWSDEFAVDTAGPGDVAPNHDEYLGDLDGW